MKEFLKNILKGKTKELKEDVYVGYSGEDVSTTPPSQNQEEKVVVLNLVEPDHDIDFPDFITNFCIPEYVYEREYDSDTIKELIEQVASSSQLIAEEHKKNSYPFFVTNNYYYDFKFFDLKVGFYGPHSIPFITFDEKSVLNIKYKKDETDTFIIERCEMTDEAISKVAVFMIEYINETAKKIKRERRKRTLSKLEKMKCPTQ